MSTFDIIFFFFKYYIYGGKQNIVQKPHFKVSTCLEKKVLNILQSFFFLVLFCKHFKSTLSKNQHKIHILSIIFIHLKPLNPPIVDTERLLSLLWGMFSGDRNHK